MTLRIGKEGPGVTVQPDRRPDTILEADPEAVLRLAAGATGIDEALSRATVHGDPRVVTTVLRAAQP
jgi:hypothetical protein